MSYNKVGDVLVDQGNLTEALKSFRDGLVIAERLAKTDPNNAGWQRDLSVLYNKVGDVLVDQGDLTDGRAYLQNALAILKQLDEAGRLEKRNSSITRIDAQLAKLSIREAAGAGRYAEALLRQEALTAKVEAEETKRKGKPGEETAGTLGEVAWYALFAGELTKALTVADRAHALLPDNLTIETNRAHALMFLGREESKTLYLAHKGKPVSGQDGKLWEHVIVEDFAEFRKAGLTHPMMAEIEKELGVSP